MKFGARKPSLSKSFKARTTSKYKRNLKKTITPGYGVKGTGKYKNPKKSVYNKLYNKTTFSLTDSFVKDESIKNRDFDDIEYQHDNSKNKSGCSGCLIGLLAFFIPLFVLPLMGVGWTLSFAIACFSYAIIYAWWYVKFFKKAK